jgi:hypothetical protein
MTHVNQFYVYAYLRARDSEYGVKGTPYYIGKGQTQRRFQPNHRVRPPTDPALNVVLSERLSEQEAHQEEVRLIKLYGRIDLGTGCLRNLTSGGEGHSNPNLETRKKISQSRSKVVYSVDSREKMRLSQLGKKRSPEHIEKIRLASTKRVRSSETKEKIRQFHLGRKHSPETIEKIRLANLGRHFSPEHKEKIRLSNLGKHSK